MFTIDFLQGKGLPTQGRPIIVAIAIVPLLIPLMTAAVTAVCCVQNRTMIETHNHIIRDNQQKMAALGEDLAAHNAIRNQIAGLQGKLEQIDKALRYRIQTTPIWVELITSLPDNLIITQFDLMRSDQHKKQTDAKTGGVQYITSVQRKLKLTVGGSSNATTDQSAEQYVQALRSSKGLSAWFNGVQIIARSNGVLEGQNCALYEIECNLKEQN